MASKTPVCLWDPRGSTREWGAMLGQEPVSLGVSGLAFISASSLPTSSPAYAPFSRSPACPLACPPLPNAPFCLQAPRGSRDLLSAPQAWRQSQTYSVLCSLVCSHPSRPLQWWRLVLTRGVSLGPREVLPGGHALDLEWVLEDSKDLGRWRMAGRTTLMRLGGSHVLGRPGDGAVTGGWSWRWAVCRHSECPVFASLCALG